MDKTISVTRSNEGKNRIITLPRVWVRDRGDPNRVYIIVGNFILISLEEDSESLSRAAELLEGEGLFKLLEHAEMEVVHG